MMCLQTKIDDLTFERDYHEETKNVHIYSRFMDDRLYPNGPANAEGHESQRFYMTCCYTKQKVRL